MASTPNPDFVLRGHNSAVNTISFIEQSSLLSADVNGTIKLWDLTTRRAITCDHAHNHSIISIHSLPNTSHKFVSGGRDECVKVWDKAQFESSVLAPPVPITTLHTGALHFCNIAVESGLCKSGNMLATPSNSEHRALLWDLRTNSVVMELHTDKAKGTMTSLHLEMSQSYASNESNESNESRSRSGSGSGSGSTGCSGGLLIGLEDGSVCMHDLRYSRHPLGKSKSYHSHDAGVGVGVGVGVGAGGKCTIENDTDVEVEDMEITSNTYAYMSLLDQQPVMCVDITPDGCSMLTGSAGDTIYRVDSIACPRSDTSSSSTAVGDSASVGASEPHLLSTQFSNNSTTTTTTTTTTTLPNAGTSSIKIRGDGRIAVTGHWDGTARIFEMKKKKLKPLAILSHHRESVFSVAFSNINTNDCSSMNLEQDMGGGQGGGIFATASKDTTIAVWSVYASTYKHKGDISHDKDVDVSH